MGRFLNKSTGAFVDAVTVRDDNRQEVIDFLAGHIVDPRIGDTVVRDAQGSVTVAASDEFAAAHESAPAEVVAAEGSAVGDGAQASGQDGEGSGTQGDGEGAE